MLASGSNDSTIKLWNVSDGSVLETYDQETGTGVRSIQFSPDGQLFTYGRDDATVVLARDPLAGGCTRDPQWICDGDVDGDGQVNPVDSGLVQASFGSTDETDLCQYDVDCDGQINPVDSGIVQSLFGTCEEPRRICP